MVYACEEHLDEAIDEFVYKNETPPDIIKLDTAEAKSCFLCGKTAVYKICEYKENV